MPADVDVFQGENGLLPDGSPRPWAWVRGRARKVFGDVVKKKPFSRDVNGRPIAATVSSYDHAILTAEQVGWRYVASDGQVYDLGDFMLLLIEDLIDRRGVTGMQELIVRAKVLRPWPSDCEGRPDFE